MYVLHYVKNNLQILIKKGVRNFFSLFFAFFKRLGGFSAVFRYKNRKEKEQGNPDLLIF